MTADYRRAWKHHWGDTETYQIFHLDTLSTGCFGEPFPASFKRRGTAALAGQDPCFIRHFGTALLNDIEPRFWGIPTVLQRIWIAAGNAMEAPNLLNSRHQGTARTPQHQCHSWGTDNVCYFSLTNSTLTNLFWTQHQLFQFTMVSTPVEQNSLPIPYKRTKHTHTFCLTVQPVRRWKDTCMSWPTTDIS